MATGFVFSSSERLRRIEEILVLIKKTRTVLADAVDFEIEHLALEDGGLSLSIDVGLIYNRAKQLLQVSAAALIAELELNLGIAQGIFTAKSLGVDITAMNLDVDNGASKATITRVGTGSPAFSSDFAAGDSLTLTNCEDAVNNGTFVVDTVTATVITLDAVISGGVDNANDKSMVITLIKKA